MLKQGGRHSNGVKPCREVTLAENSKAGSVFADDQFAVPVMGDAEVRESKGVLTAHRTRTTKCPCLSREERENASPEDLGRLQQVTDVGWIPVNVERFLLCDMQRRFEVHLGRSLEDVSEGEVVKQGATPRHQLARCAPAFCSRTLGCLGWRVRGRIRNP